MSVVYAIVGTTLAVVFVIGGIAIYIARLNNSLQLQIVNRRNVEAQLRASEEKYRVLFEKSEDPMWVIFDNVFMIANRSAAQILGYDSVEELKNVHPSKLSPEFQPDGEASFEKANRMMQTAYEKGYHRFEWVHLRKKGDVLPVEVTLTSIPYQDRAALYCVWRDISAKKQSEHDLQAATREAETANRAKSDFLASMSHELRTPLNAIIGFAQMMVVEAFGPHSSPKYLEYARDIQSSGEHLISIVNDVLDLSKIESGQMECRLAEFALGHAIEECARLIDFKRAGVAKRIEIDLSKETPSVYSDVRLFRQVMINLLANADKYTPSHGKIRITTDADGHRGTILRITDEGIGIALEDMERVLEPFGQARTEIELTHEGTGLGLSLSKKLMELQGGKLEIESELDVGTTVVLTFPAAPANPA